MWKALIALTAGFLLIAYLFKLDTDVRRRKRLSFSEEIKRYYYNMQRLGYDDWQIDELIKDYTTLDEVKKANASMERSFKKHSNI